ncbi:MAG TPA: helix-turn-helix domain-containing protein [Chloroflexia bacterium]|nr:helix-turn-helix domain-containing protein [Chloroflexia bacterium]
MAFGKKGRPPEDRLARQHEIYEAISPLILEVGARRLSMRQAAHAACVSVGGLYHYFPTKRDLVLHGLRPEAIRRCCQDFEARFGHLANVDGQRYVDEGIEDVVRVVGFCRPAVHSALELGTESFWEVIDTLLTSTALQVEASLHRMIPQLSDEDLHQCGRAIRRSMCAALLDKNISPGEFRDELHMLFNGFLARSARARQAQVETSVSTAVSVS